MASTKNAISTECVRESPSSREGASGGGAGSPVARRRTRMRYAAISTTIDQPAPISSWLPPVMFASASGANSAGCLPAFHVNTKSTAYSGSTATSASSASARPAEMSSCTTSAAQASMNAAPTTARPKSTAATRGSG